MKLPVVTEACLRAQNETFKREVQRLGLVQALDDAMFEVAHDNWELALWIAGTAAVLEREAVPLTGSEPGDESEVPVIPVQFAVHQFISAMTQLYRAIRAQAEAAEMGP